MADKIGVAILAAGLGKRMGVPTAKPLIPLMGQKLVDFPLVAAVNFCSDQSMDMKVGVVVGHQKEEVESYLKERHKNLSLDFPVQKEQKGTADALRAYFDSCPWAKDMDYTLVLCADTPLLTKTELNSLWKTLKDKNWNSIAATFRTKNPTGYGRIIQGDVGFKIVEEKDASDEERLVNEVNSGLYIFETNTILKNLLGVDSNNKSGEFYLTDVFQIGSEVGTICFDDESPFLGVNSPVQLSQALHQLKSRINEDHQNNGVLILERQHTYIEPTVQIAPGATIYPNCYLHGKTTIATGVEIEPGSIIKDSQIAEGVTIKAYSYLEEAKVAPMCQIGPYARLRPGTDLGEKCKIGNFVEVKKAKLDSSVSVSHLSYVGDAEIGENVNIGCGFITCNYDGEAKHKTVIGKNSFIGSDTQMIAPITIGESAFVASGSTINQDVPSEGFALSRSRQVTKENMASRFLKGKWSIKKK
ncbi:MAG: bifunctional UDP-N-acetylglucosamine diphosphorylase/glucosamine-1-phosphate N-acetyltransferase GlmU [Bacteriovoracaceae bacterium]|nr:bifunctional UDP-N-acetylglucosamine diphosphorylase/glucosamine-1-phosphate N-acetyltransferase GlmU [Bacteriovoracaceae bacterium]